MRSRIIVSGLVAVLAVTLAACGGSGHPKAKATGSGAPLASMLPANIRSAGVINVGSDIEYAPIEVYDAAHRAVGFDIDIANALGKQLGVRFNFIDDTDFNGIIAAMLAGRFDVIISAMTDSKLREKQVNFVDYLTAGESVIVRAGNPKHITGVDNSLCGTTLSVQTGTVEADGVAGLNKNCTQAGKPKIKPATFGKQDDAYLALASGRADAAFADAPVNDYAVVQSHGRFALAGGATPAEPYGIAVPKKSTQLLNALQAALKAIIASGEYDQILAKWGLQPGANKFAKINGAVD